MGWEGSGNGSDMFGNGFIFGFGHKNHILSPKTFFLGPKHIFLNLRNVFRGPRILYMDPKKSILGLKKSIFGSHEIDFILEYSLLLGIEVLSGAVIKEILGIMVLSRAVLLLLDI